MNWRKLQRVVFVSFLVLVIGSIIAYEIYGSNLDLESFRKYLGSFGVWAPFFFIIFYIIGTIFIPSTPFMAIAGVLFGFKYGLIYTVIGGLVSSIIVFFISRKLGKEGVDKILEHKYLKHLNGYNKRLGNNAVWDLIILRAIPFMPFNVLNILMGVSKIKTFDYITGTLIGFIPSNVVVVYFGNIIAKII